MDKRVLCRVTACIPALYLFAHMHISSSILGNSNEMTNFGFEDVMSGMRQFHDAMHEARVHPPWQTANREAQQRWNPYSFEGG